MARRITEEDLRVGALQRHSIERTRGAKALHRTEGKATEWHRVGCIDRHWHILAVTGFSMELICNDFLSEGIAVRRNGEETNASPWRSGAEISGATANRSDDINGKGKAEPRYGRAMSRQGN